MQQWILTFLLLLAARSCTVRAVGWVGYSVIETIVFSWNNFVIVSTHIYLSAVSLKHQSNGKAFYVQVNYVQNSKLIKIQCENSDTENSNLIVIMQYDYC